MAAPSTNTPQIQTIVLKAGQSAYIPTNAVILSVDGDATLTSDCIDITPKPMKCFEMVYTLSIDGSEPTDAWAYEDTGNKIKGVFVNGIEHACDFDINTGVNGATSFLVAKGSGAIVDALAQYFSGSPSDKGSMKVTFKAPLEVGSNVYFNMNITTAGSVTPGIIRVYAKEIDCADMPLT